MPTPLILPKFDMDQENGTIASWYKQEGDFVKLEEPVLSIETDKISIDVPSPAAGTLAKIMAEPGDVIPVTTVIAYVLAEGETEADLPEEQTSQGKSPTVKSSTKPANPKATDKKVTPVAKRVADEHAIDLGKIESSNAKIKKQDVINYLIKTSKDVEHRVSVAATPAARRIANEKGIDLHLVSGSGPRGRVQASDVEQYQSRDINADERDCQVVPLDNMRRTIANRLQKSFQDSPHITLSVEVDVTPLENLRRKFKQISGDSDDRKVSMTAILTKLVGWALNRNPYINASFENNQILLWNRINIGIATALDDGLIVPIIKDADEKSILEINADLVSLTQRARTKTLGLENLQGGTFTISNLGMFGINHFTAIINPPQAAILAVGSVVRKPVVINAQDEIAVRPMMDVTLSADHRVIDGVVAARFLNDLTMAIENPEILLLGN